MNPSHRNGIIFIKPENALYVKVLSKDKKTKVFHKENTCVTIFYQHWNARLIRFKHTKYLMSFRLKIIYKNEAATNIFLSLTQQTHF